MATVPRLALAIVATSGAYTAALVWPAVAAPLLLVSALPGLVLAATTTALYSLAWCAATAMALAVVFGVETTLAFILPVGIPAVVMAFGVERSWPIERTIVAGVLSWCIGIGCWLAVAYGGVGAVLTAARQQLSESFDLAVAASRSMGAADDTVAAMEADKLAIVTGFVEILPALVVLSGALFAIFNVLVVRSRTGAYGAVNLRLWRTPDTLIWLLIVAGFGMLMPNSPLAVAARNVFIILLGCYFCQGMAIVSYYLVRFKLPRALRIASYALIAVHQVLTATVLALGVFDIWVNFRRLHAGPADVQSGD